MSDSSNLVGKAGEVYELCGDIAFACKKEWEANLKTYRYAIPAYACKVVIGEDGFFRGSILNLYAVTSSHVFDEEFPVIGRFVYGKNGKVYTFFCEVLKPYDDNATNHQDAMLLFAIKKDVGKIVDDAGGDMVYKGDFTITGKKQLFEDSECQRAYAEAVCEKFEILVKERRVRGHIRDFINHFDYRKERLLDVLDQYEYTKSIVCGHNS